MIHARLSQLASVIETQLVTGDAPFRGVSTDTRTIEPGMLFVALRGERFDGHEFAQAAKERGAVALLVERELPVDLPQLVCADTLEALGEAARWWREHVPAQVIGITGSNGKTTVKTLTASILSRIGRCHVNTGNLNNEIGLPLTLLKLPADAEFAVLEMGAGKPGDIEYLAQIARPDIGLVNNVAPAHLEPMRSKASRTRRARSTPRSATAAPRSSTPTTRSRAISPGSARTSAACASGSTSPPT